MHEPLPKDTAIILQSAVFGNVRSVTDAMPGKMELAPGGIEPDAKQTMENIGDILRANGLTFDDVFKCTAMLANMSKWGVLNKIYVTHFKPEHLPARSALGANGLALGAQVELECWAFAHK